MLLLRCLRELRIHLWVCMFLSTVCKLVYKGQIYQIKFTRVLNNSVLEPAYKQGIPKLRKT